MTNRTRTPSPVWQIQLLGDLRAVHGEQVISRFRRYKDGALLAYLAYFLQRPHPREELIELLWPEVDPGAGRDRLSTTLSALRRQLEAPGVPARSVLVADRAAVGLNPTAIITDVAAFEARLEAAATAGSSLERAHLLTGAVQEYGGELLPGHLEEWVFPERQRLAEAYLQALGQLASHREQQGDFPRALDYARRMVAADPLREEGHQELIRLLVAAGQREAAERQYQELERLLEAELGLAPAAATRTLVRGIDGQRAVSMPANCPVGAPFTPAPATPPPAGVPALPAPTGTVTFLLAAPSEEGPHAARWPLDLEHLRPGIEQRQGYLVPRGEGLLLAAFQRPSDALGAAIAAQHTGRHALRMALHTGEVEFEAGQYLGRALDHGVRLLRAAHPEQILISESTAALIRAEVEPGKAGVELIELGTYRLRDTASGVDTPERLFQANYPGMLAPEFPLPKAAPFRRGQLPPQLSRFFGREDEIALLREWLRDGQTRLVTLTGPGGSGKTRLAQKAAEALVEPFRGAVWFVPLAEVIEVPRIVDALVTVLGLPRSPAEDPFEQVVAFLTAQPSLLVLDNFEQIVAEGAYLVRSLLERVPTLTCLVTSRQPLSLAGEREFPVAPLPVPGVRGQGAGVSADEDAVVPLTPDPWPLTTIPSVALFVDRAQAVRPDFQVTAGNAAAVAELCRRLEGLPLALELAAARAGVLTPAQLVEQLARPLDVLVSRRRDAAPRHRSLRAALEWSYRLLLPELRRFFARLSVFRGGWTLEAAERVCNEPAALDVLELLRECSLLTVDVTEAEGRYRLLETLREYAWEQLGASEERDEIQKRHWEWYLRLAERGRAAVSLPEQREWLQRLEREIDNFRAALRACHEAADRHGDQAAAEAGLRLAHALKWFWVCRGYLAEGFDALETALADGADLPAAVRAPPLGAAGNMAASMGDEPRAQALRQQSRQAYEAMLQAARPKGHRWEIATTVLSVVETCVWMDDLDATWRYGQEARQLMEELGDADGLARVLEALAGVALARGDLPTARPLLVERLSICRRLGTPGLLVHALGGMGHLERDGGNYGQAQVYYQESLVLRRELGDKFALAQSLEDLAVLAGRQGQAERAIRLLGAAEAYCETLGTAVPCTPAAAYHSTAAASRTTLGDEATAAAWAAGRAMSQEQAVAYALEETTDANDA